MRGILPGMLAALMVSGCGCGETGISGHADATEDIRRDEVDAYDASDPDLHAEPDPIDVVDAIEDPDAADPIPDAEIETSHWFLRMGDSETEGAMGLAARGDGSIVVSGYRGGDPDLQLATIDGTGRIVEQQVVEGVTGWRAGSSAALADGSVVMAGDTHMGMGTRTDVWISKMDRRGSLVWQKMVGGPHYDRYPTLSATHDGGFVLSTVSESFTTAPGLWLVGFAPGGSARWQVVLEPPWAGSEVSAGWTAPRPDGGLYVSASVRLSPTGPYEPWILSLDEHRSVIWQMGLNGGYGSCAHMTVDDVGMTCAGSTWVSLDSAAWVVRVSIGGEVLWQKAYGAGTVQALSAILPRGDGGFIVVGTATVGVSQNEIWIASLDPDGGIGWQKLLGEPEVHDTPFASIEHLGDLVILGSRDPLTYPRHNDVLVARLGMDGSFAGTCSLLRDASVGSGDVVTWAEATDVTPSASTGTVLDAPAVFSALDTPVELICPE